MRLSLPVVYTCLASALAVAPVSPSAAAAAPTLSQVEQDSRRHFTIAAAEGAVALEAFAEQAGAALVYLLEHVHGVRTNAIEGWYTPLEALERMVADTVLIVMHDRETGTLTIRRATDSHTLPSSLADLNLDPSTQPNTMKRKNPIALLGAWLALMFTPAHPASAQPSSDLGRGAGTIEGQISNRATSVNLQGAAVRLEGTDVSTLTERDGTYRLTVTPGTYSVTASYSGLDTERATVTVQPGASVRLNFALTSDIYEMDAVVVATEREGNALAHTLQRHSPNVKNVVSTDAFGSLSGNPAELLERITGVVVDRVGGDARFISIRGIPGPLNSVQIDGNRRATAGNRGLQFESIGSDHIESIEVIKAPTPDMDADAIGGTVNLKSRSAFDLTGRRISYSIGGLIGAKRYDAPVPAATFTFSDIFDVLGGQNNFGISFSANFRQHIAAMDFSRMTYEATNDSPAYMRSLSFDGRFNLRSRWGSGLKLDYKLSERASLFANLTFSPHSERATVPITTITTAASVATLDAQGQPTGSGAILPGYTDDRTEARALPASMVSLSTLRRTRDVDAYSMQFGGRVREDVYELDYDVSYSYTKITDFPYRATMQVRGVGWILDRTNESRWTPEVSFTDGPNPLDLDNYRNNMLQQIKVPTDGAIYGTQFNYRRDFDVAVPAYLKTGVKLRQEEQDSTDLGRRWRYVGPDGLIDSGDENLGQFLDTARNYRPMDGHFPRTPVPSAFGMRDHLEANPGLWREDVAFGSANAARGPRYLRERVYAAYILGNAQIGRLSVLGGMRVEQTNLDADGPLDHISPEEAARRAAWTGPLTDEEIIRRNQARFVNRRSVSSKYRDVFPGVHLKYELLPGLLFRGSYSPSIGRPAFTNLIPNDNIDDDNQIVRVNNTGLKPQYSDNFDVTVEYYFEPIGLFSVGVFLKEIADFIFNTSGGIIPEGPDNGFGGNFAGYELRSQANGGFAKIQGMETNYQQQLTFLPGWWAGFGVFANHTWLETEGDFGNIGTVQTTGTLPGFTPRAANAGISYIRNKINFRIMYGMAGETLVGFNPQDHLKRFRVASHRIDLKLKYTLTDRHEFYIDVFNLANDKQREFWGVHDRPRMILDRNDPQIHFGINGRF